MTLLEKIFSTAALFAPVLFVLALLACTLYAIQFFFSKRYADIPGARFRQQIIVALVVIAGLVLLVAVMPVSNTLREQLLGLVGILLSAIIALSSTTFMGNAMAGIMLRTIRSFKGGDYLKTESHFGRVSEMGLFHVEIQTEDSDLTTLPNLYLVSTPYTVIRSSETIVSAEVSLGYDLHHNTVVPLLKEAAAAAGLQEPFVHITSLGDFSVSYKVGGLLEETKLLISVRSRLRQKMLDALHGAGLEIVSPNFENARAFAPETRFIPTPVQEEPQGEHEPSPETFVFEKADLAENIERLTEALDETEKKIRQTEEELGSAESDGERDKLSNRLAQLQLQKEKLQQISQEKETEQEQDEQA